MKKDALIDKTDEAIRDLVYDKVEIRKAYNYYNGIRDKDQFRYLEEVYGPNNPTTLNFTALIKKHVDALLGEYMGFPKTPQISCKDSETISNIDRSKQLELASRLTEYLKSMLKNSIYAMLNGKQTNDQNIERQIEEIKENLDNTFVSEYELAAQNVIEYIMQSRETDIDTKLYILFFDLLCAGCNFYKVKESYGKNDIIIKTLSPLDTFVEVNPDSQYIKDASRAVVRYWLTKEQIFAMYGNDLSKEDRDKIKDMWDTCDESQSYYAIVNGQARNSGILANTSIEVSGAMSKYDIKKRVIPVYEVEWIETDSDDVMQRYETTRIGESVYILKGKNEKVFRSKSNPKFCHLSINGVYFMNRAGVPYSMVLACTHLQDQYDLLNYYRDNLIASSGTVGDWIDYTLIPSELGVSLPERVMKWQSLKKQGLGILNSSQEGRMQTGAAPLNTIFNGFDDTVKMQSIQAIQMAIDSIEATMSSITGVFRERLNGIEARDAVTNIKIGQMNSFIITKSYYHQMDLVVNELLLDALNLSKEVYKKGLVGTIRLGDKGQRTFTALPEYFTMTDYDVRILTSSDVAVDLEKVKSVIPEFVKNGSLSADIIIEIMTSKSIPELKNKLQKAVAKNSVEQRQMQQMQQQLQQLQEQLNSANKGMEEASKQLQSITKQKEELEKSHNEAKMRIDWYKAKSDRDYKESMVQEAKRRTEVEIAQIRDGNPYNDEVKDI